VDLVVLMKARKISTGSSMPKCKSHAEKLRSLLTAQRYARSQTGHQTDPSHRTHRPRSETVIPIPNPATPFPRSGLSRHAPSDHRQLIPPVPRPSRHPK
jgi:hypothetical protein